MKIRTTRTRRTVLVGTLAALSLVAVACGDDGDSTPATDPAPPTVAPATTAPAEDMNGEMDDEADDSMTEDMGGEMMGAQFGPACSAVPEDGAGSFDGMAQDPAATAASNNPLLSTLVSAVAAADLVDTLNSEGPFTIFAPVNDAFAALDPATLETVLADADLLTGILTYHVIAGEHLTAADLGAAGSAVTVNGGELNFGTDGTSVNGVDVLCSDVTVANATVHIVGEVLIPEV